MYEKWLSLKLITVGYAKGTLVKAHKKPLSESYSIIGTNILGSIEEEDSSFEMWHCNISNAVFEDVNLHQCSIENANMYQAKFSNINMKEATISFSNLEGVQIVNCLVDGLIINGKKVEVE